MNPQRRRLAGFTLIELLTVVAISGVLAAVLVPAVGQVREKARRTIDGSNLRQIGMSALLYANANQGAFPAFTHTGPGPRFGLPNWFISGETVDGFAAALAVGTGLNDATLWVVPGDKRGIFTKGASTVYVTTSGNGKQFTPYQNQQQPGFDGLSLAYGVVLGLKTSNAPTTPLIYTRGIARPPIDGTWTFESGVYGDAGGYIFFTAGNLAFYDNLGSYITKGKLIASDGSKTNRILDTLRSC